MTIATPTSNNSPAHFANAQLQAAITAQTTALAGLTAGTTFKNAAQAKLDQMKREFVDTLLNTGQLHPDAIINNLTYGQQS
jgi:hypothetical protein